MVVTSSGRVLFRAGKMPKSSPVPMESAAAKRITMGRIPTWSMSLPSAGRMDAMRLSVQCATSRLAMPPISARTVDSVSSWPSRRRRVAPSESRTAISMLRPAPRASSRLAMFAQAMSSTVPVIPMRRRMGVRASPCIELCPRAPSSTVISRCRNSAIRCSLIPSCSGASTSLTIGR
jgi:hypothetical protein